MSNPHLEGDIYASHCRLKQQFSEIGGFGTLDEVAEKVVAQHEKQSKGRVEVMGKKEFNDKGMKYYEISTKVKTRRKTLSFSLISSSLVLFLSVPHLPLSPRCNLEHSFLYSASITPQTCGNRQQGCHILGPFIS